MIVTSLLLVGAAATASAADMPNPAVGAAAISSVPLQGIALGQDGATMRRELGRRGYAVSTEARETIARRGDSVIRMTTLRVTGGERITGIDATLDPADLSAFSVQATRILQTPPLKASGSQQWSTNGLPCLKTAACIQIKGSRVTLRDGGRTAALYARENGTAAERKASEAMAAMRFRDVPKGKVLINGKLMDRPPRKK